MTANAGTVGDSPPLRNDPGPPRLQHPDAVPLRPDWPAFDAILLTGGSARRLGGIDKPGARVGGVPLAVRAAAALRGCSRLIVVGSTYPDLFADVVTREEPPGGGPVAAVAAGVTAATAPYVVVLAADLPFIDAATITALRRSLACPYPARSAAVLVDDEGHDQLLVSAWRRDVLRRSVGAGAPGTPMRAVFAAAGPISRVRACPDQPAVTQPPVWWDCDTAEQLARARDWAESRGCSSGTPVQPDQAGTPAQHHQRGELR